MSVTWTDEDARPEPPRARQPVRRNPFNAKASGLRVAPEERRPSLGLAFAARREAQRHRVPLLERPALHRAAWVAVCAVGLMLTVLVVGRLARWR